MSSLVSLSNIAPRADGSDLSAEVVRLRPRQWKRPERPLDVRLERAGFAVAALAVEATSQGEQGHVHAPTVIAVLAVLAAEQALHAAAVDRRASLEQTPGGWIVGGPADAILFTIARDRWMGGGRATVWDRVLAGALDAGLSPDAAPELDTVAAEAEAHAGAKPYPVYSLPPSHLPRGLPRATAARVRHEMLRYAADEGLCSAYECALVAGTAIGHVLTHDTAPVLLTRLAAEALIQAARQAPLPFAVC